MPAVHDFGQFAQALADNKVPCRIDPTTQSVELMSNGYPLPGQLYLRWERKVPFVQLIHFMIPDIAPARIGEVEIAIVRLNNRLEVAGLGLDHDQRRLYYRLTVPVLPPDGIAAETLLRLGKGIITNAKDLLAPFQQVVAGRPGAEIVAICEELAEAAAVAKAAAAEAAAAPDAAP